MDCRSSRSCTLLPIAAAYSGSLTGFPSRRSRSIIMTREEGLLERSRCFASFIRSPSTSSRFSITSASFTAACASKRFLLAKSWIFLFNAVMPLKVPIRMSFSFIISIPDGFLDPSKPTQRAWRSDSNESFRFFISSSRARVARSSSPWYSASSATCGSIPALLICSYSEATCWNLICAKDSESKFGGGGMPGKGSFGRAGGGPIPGGS
mmetsp:Transcript_68676/g.160959  ORF Transcript_68676/g.160959 Transcript_68676/m.160959 type:complete len:209 (-) Transcript_68676:98-724(-)